MLIDMREETYKELTQTIKDADKAISENTLYRVILASIIEAIQTNKPLSLAPNGGLLIDNRPISEIVSQYRKE